MAFPCAYTDQTIYPALITLTNQLYYEHIHTSVPVNYDTIFNQLIKDLYPDFNGEITGMHFDKISSFYRMWDPGDEQYFLKRFTSFALTKTNNFRYAVENNIHNPGSLDKIFDEKLMRLKVLCNFFNVIITLRSSFDSLCRINKELRDYATAYPNDYEMAPTGRDQRLFPPVLNGWMEGLVLTFIGNMEEEFIRTSEMAKDKIKTLFHYSLSRDTPLTINQKNSILKDIYLSERTIIQQQLNDIVMESARINFDRAIANKAGVIKKEVHAGEILNADIKNKQYWSLYSNNAEEPVEDINAYYELFINGHAGSIRRSPVIWYSPATPYDNNL